MAATPQTATDTPKYNTTDDSKPLSFPPLVFTHPAPGLKGTNAHPRDTRIKFFDEGHIYDIDGRRDFVSSTTFIHQFYEAFDADATIKRMFARGLKPQYQGKTADEIKLGWNNKGARASHQGTLVHARVEYFYNGWDEHFPYDTPPEFASHFLPFHERVVKAKGYIPYRTEWEIFDEDHELAGSVDMLYQLSADDPDVLVIYDWKRSCKLGDRTGFSGKTMLAPLDHLPDCAYWHYAMQLNLYRHILETKYGKTIAGMYLVGLHPDLEAGFQQAKVPVLQQEIEDLFAVRREQVEAKRALAAAQGDDATRTTAHATTAATHTATA